MKATPLTTTLQLADSVNRVAAFLAANDFPLNQIEPAALQALLGAPVADVLLLLGNSVLHTAECAFAAYRRGVARCLLISGGLGHSTPYLIESLHAHPLYRAIDPAGKSEAQLLAEVATRFCGIDEASILLETESANCGENALFSFRMLQDGDIAVRTLLLVQDPTMQRRSHATLHKVWQDRGMTLTVANYPTFVPAVKAEGASFSFVTSSVNGLWPMERFVSLLLGELPRLRDDANGYGPAGRGFIGHLEIPSEVLAAHQRLAGAFPELMR